MPWTLLEITLQNRFCLEWNFVEDRLDRNYRGYMRYPKFSMATQLAASFSFIFLIAPTNSLLGRDMEGVHVYQLCYWEWIPYHYTLWIIIFWEMERIGMIQKSPMLIIMIQFASAGQHYVIRSFTYIHGYLRHKCEMMRCSQSPHLASPIHTQFPWLCSWLCSWLYPLPG